MSASHKRGRTDGEEGRRKVQIVPRNDAERGQAAYPHTERDTHFHYNSYRNLRGKMVDLYDDFHSLLDAHSRDGQMPAEVWNDLVSLKRRFDALVCCPACADFVPSCKGDARVIKCGHVCHTGCHAEATEMGMCKICREK